MGKYQHIFILSNSFLRIFSSYFLFILYYFHLFQGTKIGTETIIFKDKDSISVNSNISYEVLNDTLEIIVPVCNAYENDQSGLKSTIISCSESNYSLQKRVIDSYNILELNFSRNGILSKSPYCFGLQAMDTSVDVTHNFIFKSVCHCTH